MILNPLIPRIRQSAYLANFLDSVNVSALAVMLVVAIKLGFEVIFDLPDGAFNWKPFLIFALSLTAFLSIKKINPAYLVSGGALTGYILYLLN
jgi:chromate transporter